MAFLNISTKNKNGILKLIDEQNYMGLGYPGCGRLDLYSFMVALGYRSGYASDFDGAKESLVREEYVKNNNISHAFSALYFGEHKDNIEDIAITDKVYGLVDKFANTGFSVMTDFMKDFNQYTLSMKLIAEMDAIYNEHKEEFSNM